MAPTASRSGGASSRSCASGTANLYGQLVTRTAVTLGSTSDIVLGINVMQD